jgi:trk system potassium uptake protein
VFLAMISLGTVLLSLPAAGAGGQPVHWVDALFTATSAVCVTGLTVVETGTRFSTFGHVVIIGLAEAGGIGFVSMAVLISVLVGRRVTLRERLLVQESLGQVKVQGMVRLVLHILALTLTAQAIGALLLWLRWQEDLGLARAAWFAVFHSISAFTNAGFDLFAQLGQDSLQGYRSDVLVTVVVGVLIVLGSLGLPVLDELARWPQTRRFSLHAQLVLVVSGALLVGGAILLLITESETHTLLGELPWGERILVAVFHSISARTGGLTTVPLAGLSSGGLLVLMALMFVGAATASMGGGIKVNVLGALLATLWSVARGRDEVEAFGRTIPRETIYKALAVLMGSATLVMVMTIVVVTLEGSEPLPLMFEIVSAVGTVGYSLGASAQMSPAGKLVVALTILIGRIGPLTMIAALARPPSLQHVRYPDEKILIG